MMLPEAEYFPDQGIRKIDFSLSGLYPTYNEYSSKNLVQVKIKNTIVLFSEIFAQDRRDDTDGNGSYTTLFDSILFIGDFNSRKFSGDLMIKTKGKSNFRN